MGTSFFKSAALLGAVLLAASPAYSAGAGGGTAAGGMGTSAGTAGTVRSNSQATSTMPGTAGLATPLGTSSTNALSRPSTSMDLAINQNLTTNQNLSSDPAINPKGLTASEQSLLANFGTSSAPGNSGPTPSEQMQANAQANADSAHRNGATLAPTGLSATGSTTGDATASTAGPGASVATTSGITTAAPNVSPPVANNPGTLAETAQPGAL